MKLRSVKFLTFEGFKNVWVNRLMSIASIGVLVACMLLIGLAIIISINVDKAMGNLEQQNVVMVYFKDENAVKFEDNSSGIVSESVSNTENSSDFAETSSNTQNNQDESTNTSGQYSDENIVSDTTDSEDVIVDSTAKALSLCSQIQKIDNVASVEFISRETGLERMLNEMQDSQKEYFCFLEDENPLSHGAKVKLKDLSKFDNTVKSIESIEGVDNVYYQRDLAVKINSIKKGMSVAAFWIIGLLLIISLVIVANTIRVTMYNRKLEISIMKAVGATNFFVRFPFVVEGILLGLVSAGVTTGLLYFIYKAVIDTMKEALSLNQAVPFNDFIWIVSAIFVGIGVVAGLIGSTFMINKYLRKEGSEFSAL